jgi:hypothetical protein
LGILSVTISRRGAPQNFGYKAAFLELLPIFFDLVFGCGGKSSESENKAFATQS